MATPGQLVEVMADVLGISTATVTQYDRVLAENGLRSKSGRGTSAAKVTSRDAANLLIALATSPILGSSAKDAVVNCEAYASLPHGAILKGLATDGFPTLANLPKGHSFGKALTALIDAAGSGKVVKLPGGKPYALDTPFEIRFIGPHPRAEISIPGTKSSRILAKLTYSNPEEMDSRKIPDLRRISSLGFRTIQSLGSLIYGEGGGEK